MLLSNYYASGYQHQYGWAIILSGDEESLPYNKRFKSIGFSQLKMNVK